MASGTAMAAAHKIVLIFDLKMPLMTKKKSGK